MMAGFGAAALGLEGETDEEGRVNTEGTWSWLTR